MDFNWKLLDLDYSVLVAVLLALILLPDALHTDRDLASAGIARDFLNLLDDLLIAPILISASMLLRLLLALVLVNEQRAG